MVTWENIIDALPQSPDEEAGEVLGIWGDDGEIICKKAEVADAIADILETLGWNAVPSEASDGYYHVSA